MLAAVSNPTLILYSRDECPLCEEAEALLMECGLEARWVDIADSIELLGRYRDRIPVLRREDTGAELGWPFDHRQLRQWADQA